MHRIAAYSIVIESKCIGEMNHIYSYCGAKKFLNETHFLYCNSGKVLLAPHSPCPPLLQNLMTENHVDYSVNQSFFNLI